MHSAESIFGTGRKSHCSLFSDIWHILRMVDPCEDLLEFTFLDAWHILRILDPLKDILELSVSLNRLGPDDVCLGLKCSSLCFKIE